MNDFRVGGSTTTNYVVTDTQVSKTNDVASNGSNKTHNAIDKPRDLPGVDGVKVSDGTLQGTDWNALIDKLGAMNLSVSTTAILTLLIEIMAQMRQDAREASFESTVNSLESGQKAAQNMRDAAKDKFISAIVSATVTMVGSAAAMGASGNQALSMAINSFTSGLASLAGSFNTYDASLSEAAAELDRAFASYEGSLSQQEQDFFRQLGDAIKNALASMKAVDQAQHQATGAIYGM